MADKSQVIQALEEMAVLLELNGENPFKTRAYSNAARTLQSFDRDLMTTIEKGEINNIKGIGKGIAAFITELVRSGKSDEMEILKAKIPPGVIELLRIPGMGPKKVKAVWEELQIKSIGELEYACQENRLIDLEGFGEKSQQKILQGITLIRKYSERHLISLVMAEAEKLLNYLKPFKGVERIEIAGSLRRWKETIKDIDLVVSAQPVDHATIMDHFVKYPEVEQVNVKGETKGSIMLNRGMNADLRIVTADQFPYTLHHSTGSQTHNVALREFARKKQLKLNEYGLFEETGGIIQCESEGDIYHALGMSYIPPELRENMGEIEAALNGSLPHLVEQRHLKGVIHVHSNYSDGVNTIEELARACQSRGYSYLVISDHSKSAAYARGLSEERIKQQFQEIEELNQKLSGFRILKSIECDILYDGGLDYSDEILSTFDMVIISIHSRFNMTEEESTRRLLTAMSNPLVTIVGHLTGRLLLSREGYPVDIGKIIDQAAKKGIALELNANPHRLDLDWRWLKTAREQGVKISINPDAHRIEGLNDIFYGLGIARKGWLEPGDILNCMSVSELLHFIAQRRS